MWRLLDVEGARVSTAVELEAATCQSLLPMGTHAYAAFPTFSSIITLDILFFLRLTVLISTKYASLLYFFPFLGCVLF